MRLPTFPQFLEDAMLKLRDSAQEVDRKELLAKNLLEEHTIRHEATKQMLSVIEDAKDFMLEMARNSRLDIIQEIEKRVSDAIQYTLEDETMKFRVILCERRNALEADFHVQQMKDGALVDQDIVEFGGSVLDVASYSLQLIYLITEKPQRRELLFLDEPGRDLNCRRRQLLANWFRAAAKSLGIQLIFIAHDDEFKSIADCNNHLVPTTNGLVVETTFYDE